MEELFIRAINVSITASFLVLAIICYRFLIKSSPKWIAVLLWGFVALRLLVPFSIESSLSVIPSESTIPPTITADRFPALDTGIPPLNEVINPAISSSITSHPEYSANPFQILISVLGWVWISGMACMLALMTASLIYLRVRTRIALEGEGGIYLCDYVKTPFILGIIKPRIYLPSDISEKSYSFVVAHERAHVKRLDHVWKPLGFILLSVYWFNPILWLGYLLFCRDIESACDERVISTLSAGEKADYSEALLSLGIKNKLLFVCAPAFCEISVKSRISAISRYTAPTGAVIGTSLIICAIFAACFLTYKKTDTVSVNEGIWYAGKVIAAASTDTGCDSAPRVVFTEGGDILVESKDISAGAYVGLGKMHTAYISLSEYRSLFEHLIFRQGYDAEYFHERVRGAWRITPTAKSGIDHEEIYLLRSQESLYMGYADDDRISALYEFRFNEVLPTYLYTMTYKSEDSVDTSIILDTGSGIATVLFGGNINYRAIGTYKYENSRLIITSRDSFGIKLVFTDTGDALIYSEEKSDTKEFDRLLPDKASFSGYYQLYGASQDSIWCDIDENGRYEILLANIGSDGALHYYLLSMGEIYANNSIPFTAYDDIRFEEKDGSLYLIGEYKEGDFNSYRYRVTFSENKLIFTLE
ncbi:MAG: hypothetical protein E7617_01445 [Ruminococcaceae bacterium]|nr:hypothetical protein [Oscillospiraceae bacterium]